MNQRSQSPQPPELTDAELRQVIGEVVSEAPLASGWRRVEAKADGATVASPDPWAAPPRFAVLGAAAAALALLAIGLVLVANRGGTENELVAALPGVDSAPTATSPDFTPIEEGSAAPASSSTVVAPSTTSATSTTDVAPATTVLAAPATTAPATPATTAPAAPATTDVASPTTTAPPPPTSVLTGDPGLTTTQFPGAVPLQTVGALLTADWILPTVLPTGFEPHYAQTAGGDQHLHYRHSDGRMITVWTTLQPVGSIGPTLDVGGQLWTLNDYPESSSAWLGFGATQVLLEGDVENEATRFAILNGLVVGTEAMLPAPLIVDFGGAPVPVAEFDIAGAPAGSAAALGVSEVSGGLFCFELSYPDGSSMGCPLLIDPGALHSDLLYEAWAPFESDRLTRIVAGVVDPTVVRVELDLADGQTVSASTMDLSGSFDQRFFVIAGSVDPELRIAPEDTLTAIRLLDAADQVVATPSLGSA